MRIEDLDEFQGLTPQMVREWLTAQTPRILREDNSWVWVAHKVGIIDRHLSTALAQSIEDIAFCESMSVQALLREINPREREGVPSEAARQAHPGNWLVSGCLNQSKEKHFEVWHSRNLHLASNYPYNPDGKRIECWPLDEHGSKVRWPTDSEGKML